MRAQLPPALLLQRRPLRQRRSKMFGLARPPAPCTCAAHRRRGRAARAASRWRGCRALHAARRGAAFRDVIARGHKDAAPDRCLKSATTCRRRDCRRTNGRFRHRPARASSPGSTPRGEPIRPSSDPASTEKSKAWGKSSPRPWPVWGGYSGGLARKPMQRPKARMA